MAERISEKFAAWQIECNQRFHQLQANEEELNRIFINLYGLQNELFSTVEEKEITIRKADLQREIKSLISYAVGCIFGRYSVDCEGLCYAGGEWNNKYYQTIIPVQNNIAPICDENYFEDDLTVLVIDFIRKVYGEEFLEENLQFIADALEGNGSSYEVIRNYLLNGFYADHCKIYHKRPIYWLFSSGKKQGFKALVYMHRWQKDSIIKLWKNYIQKLPQYYDERIQSLSVQMKTVSSAERTALKKQQQKLQGQLSEITLYEKKFHHFADKITDFHLDDGVKSNYAAFADILEKIQ